MSKGVPLYTSVDLLIDVAELASLTSADTKYILVDCRADLGDHSWGRRSYQEGHILDAQFADLEEDLSGQPGVRGRHPLPTRVNFWHTAARLGIDNDTQVIAYDQGPGAYACRFWWLMRWLGHTHVRVLDGGLSAWISAGNSLNNEVAEKPFGKIDVFKPLTKTVVLEDVKGAQSTLIDARAADRFRGENETIDHTAGHIPGASCYPFTNNLSRAGTFRRDTTQFGDLPKDEPIISYCGSGVTATHNIMALLLAGFPEPALYGGSWSEWIEHPENPIATGT